MGDEKKKIITKHIEAMIDELRDNDLLTADTFPPTMVSYDDPLTRLRFTVLVEDQDHPGYRITTYQHDNEGDEASDED